MNLALLASCACLVLAGCATGTGGPGHAAHHPPAGKTAAAPGGMDSMMKSMHQMHDKMMAAKTPDERAALMKDHMKVMQEGMAMMGQMRGGGMSMDPEMMGKRMDMMEMMMQMMMDREAAKPPAKP
jgi:hypothetical protein